ncbi:unnamed protein product [Tenebrio molitor]|nr:unnamed protein product [Tenebrio molitor]
MALSLRIKNWFWLDYLFFFSFRFQCTRGYIGHWRVPKFTIKLIKILSGFTKMVNRKVCIVDLSCKKNTSVSLFKFSQCISITVCIIVL